MSSEHTLSEREALILQAVVQMYITTAEAVGSRAVVKRYGMELSPATVRNTMSDLEEAGYLEQLHTSSGRVPTDRGYRYYVNYLMPMQELTPAERLRIEQDLQRNPDDADEAMRQASHLLAQVSRQTGLVEAPVDDEARVLRVEIVPIAGTRVGVMIADSYGRVRTVTLMLDRPLGNAVASRLSRFLNEQLAETDVNRMCDTLRDRLAVFRDEAHALAEAGIEILAHIPVERAGRMFLEGATQLFEQPEFRDISRAQVVFTLLEERDRLSDLLRSRVFGGAPPRLVVVIGSESGDEALGEIGVVAAPYHVGERTLGMLGVLGPRRMPYSRLTAVVDYTAATLGRFLTRLAG